MKEPSPPSPVASTDSELMAWADQVLAYGGQHRVLMRPLYADEEGVFPGFAQSAQGYEVVDAAGRKFVDWVNGYGAVTLGYRRPEVEEAIQSQLAAGPMLSLMHSVEVEVASKLIELIPSAEMVAFGKNGSDAVTGAVRLARAVTGRDVILHYGMHGFHDWYVCQFRNTGILRVLRGFIHPFPFNDYAALEDLFERYAGEVAAVVMEPMRPLLPELGYLEAVRELTERHGALLIFDEMVTAFRLARGGAQELFGVTPDLTCLGKALANGMPLSAIVGRRKYMEQLPSVPYGMTFRGETLSLAAARAVLQIMQEEPVAEHLAQIGSEVRDSFHRACTEQHVRCELVGSPALMGFNFHPDGGISSDSIRTFFLRECAKNGVLSNGNLLPSYAHDAEAVERTVQALSASLAPVAEAIRGGKEAMHDAFRRGFARGFAGGRDDRLPDAWLEVIQEEGGALVLQGWMLMEDGCLDKVEFVAPAGERQPAERVERPDLAQAFSTVPSAAGGGFTGTLPAAGFARNGDYEFTILARRGDETVFSCPVVRRRAPVGSSTLPAPYLSEDGVLHI